MKKWYGKVMVWSLLLTLVLAGAGVAKTEISFTTVLRAEESGKEPINASVASFEQKYPDIKVNIIDASYQTLREDLLLKTQAGTPFDVSQAMASWVPTLAWAQTLEPVRNYLSDEHLANFSSSMLQDGTIDGKIYGIPIWSGPVVLQMNKNLAKEAGIGLGGPKDIFEFKEMIAKIGSLGTTKEGQKIYGLALRNDKSANTVDWFTTWLWAWGGKLVDIYDKPVFDSMGARKALEFYRWLTSNGYSEAGAGAYSTRITFSQGRAGFLFDGFWVKSSLESITGGTAISEEYVWLPVPKGWDGTNWAFSNYCDLVVCSISEHKEEAFKFVEHFMSDESVIRMIYEGVGCMPAQIRMLEKSWIDSDALEVFRKQNPYTIAVPWKHSRWPGAQDILAAAITAAVAGGNIDEIVKEVQRDLEDLVEE